MTKEQLQSKLEQIAGQVQGSLSLRLETGDGLSVSIGPQVRYSAASLIKVPILMAAFRKAARQELDLMKVITVPTKEKVGGSGVVGHMSEDVQIRLIDLMTLMIIVSDNTATNVTIDEVGLGEIQALLDETGCTGTVVGRRLMDYEARKAGRDNFASADDMVTLFKELWTGILLLPAHRGQALAILAGQQFNHKLPRLIPSDDSTTFYHKTGELSDVEHDAGILVRNGKIAYIAVLTSKLDDCVKGQDALAQIGRAVWEYLET